MMKRREKLLMGFMLCLLFQKLRLISVVTGSIVALFLCLLAFSETSSAVPITVDEIIFNNVPPTNSSILGGNVDMTYNTGSNVLKIILTNTTTGVASTDAANNLLTGLGFVLPSGINILSGSADATDETQINFTSDDVSGEWGYANGQQGQFNNAISSIDTIVASMQASTDFMFSGAWIDNANPGGPDFGLLSDSVSASIAGGLEAIQSSLVINVLLTTNSLTEQGMIDSINAGSVVISFGSSDTSVIPEPATVALLGIGLAGLAGVGARRKWKKKAVGKI